VPGVDLESEALACGFGQAPEELVRRLHRCATGLAHEMAVGTGGQMVGRRSVTEVRVDHDAELLEFLEIPVDGGQGHVRCLDLDGLDKVFGCLVARSLEQGLEQEPARMGDTPAVFAYEGQDVVHGVDLVEVVVDGK
jgi:hypothetical protein